MTIKLLKDKFDQENLEKYEKVREKFADLFKAQDTEDRANKALLLKNALGEIHNRIEELKIPEQQDADEFLTPLLDVLFEEKPFLSCSKLKPRENSDQYEEKETVLNYDHTIKLQIKDSKKNISELWKAYNGIEKLLVKESARFEKKDGNEEELVEADKELSTFVKPETKEIVISLKRFEFDEEKNETKKIKDKIIIDDLEVDVVSNLQKEKEEKYSEYFSDIKKAECKKAKFTPTSFILHIGEAGGGHYIAYVKEKDEKWYCYDDDNKSEILEASAKEIMKDAYVIKYSLVENGKVSLPDPQVATDNFGNTCWLNSATIFAGSFTSFEKYKNLASTNEKQKSSTKIPSRKVRNDYSDNGWDDSKKNETDEKQESSTEISNINDHNSYNIETDLDLETRVNTKKNSGIYDQQKEGLDNSRKNKIDFSFLNPEKKSAKQVKFSDQTNPDQEQVGSKKPELSNKNDSKISNEVKETISNLRNIANKALKDLTGYEDFKKFCSNSTNHIEGEAKKEGCFNEIENKLILIKEQIKKYELGNNKDNQVIAGFCNKMADIIEQKNNQLNSKKDLIKLIADNTLFCMSIGNFDKFSENVKEKNYSETNDNKGQIKSIKEKKHKNVEKPDYETKNKFSDNSSIKNLDEPLIKLDESLIEKKYEGSTFSKELEKTLETLKKLSQKNPGLSKDIEKYYPKASNNRVLSTQEISDNSSLKNLDEPLIKLDEPLIEKKHEGSFSNELKTSLKTLKKLSQKNPELWSKDLEKYYPKASNNIVIETQQISDNSSLKNLDEPLIKVDEPLIEKKYEGSFSNELKTSLETLKKLSQKNPELWSKDLEKYYPKTSVSNFDLTNLRGNKRSNDNQKGS